VRHEATLWHVVGNCRVAALQHFEETGQVSSSVYVVGNGLDKLGTCDMSLNALWLLCGILRLSNDTAMCSYLAGWAGVDC